MNILSNKLFFKLISFFLVALFAITQYSLPALALTGPQATVFQDHINFFNVDDCGSSSTTPDTGTTEINPCCSGTGTTLVGSNNAEMTWNYFVGKGLSNVAVAGIMGNFTIESGFDPTIQNGGGDVSDPSTLTTKAWGIPQWDPGSKVSSIQQQSGVNGNIDDLATQLQIIWWEMSTNNSPSAGWDYQTYTAINDISQATQYWQNHFEGLVGPVEQTRLDAANNWLKTAAGQGTVTPSTTSIPAAPNSCGSTSTTSSSGGYVNPLKDVQQLKPERIDQGVDYGGQGPVEAIGNGQIIGSSLTNDGWDFGGYDAFIVEHLADGTAAGKNVYVAEDCVPVSGLHTGETVTAGQPLCNITDPTSTGIETGWANSAGTLPESQMTEAGSINGGSECILNNIPTLIGQNYNQLLVSLGATSGLHETPGTCGALPSGWPAWN